MTVYFEDKDIIVCEKPYGISSQKSNSENMIDMLEKHTHGEVFVVHRLDTATTGIMVYAKNKKSAADLGEQVKNRTFSKEYLALCHGKTEENGEMTDYLYHDVLRNKSFVKKSSGNGSKIAKLEFRTLGSAKTDKNETLSLVKVKLHTGRTHQIRVQFASRGYVLYGDGKYGAKDNDKIALHSNKIGFYHPETKEWLEFSSLPNGEIWSLFEY